MNGTGTLYYTITDHLGSIVQLIDENGTVIDETNYGPWGGYRNPITWEYDNTASLSMLHRGYTGHEMMNNFDLIHMNGRMYDPALGRMLSPDNYVQAPENPQNYNRYAYCYNNPLKYTDPDGEIIVPLAAYILYGSYLHFTGHTSSQIFKSAVPLALSIAAPEFMVMLNIGMSGSRGQQMGMTYAGGMARGVAGNALSYLGLRIGGTNMGFGKNMALSLGQGTLSGAFNSALWGTDIKEGIRSGIITNLISTTVYSENFGNWVKGGGFYTDQKIYNMILEEGDRQGIIDYFVGQGTYVPYEGDVGNTNPITGEITFSELAFQKGWKYFKMVYHEELFHQADVLAGNYDNIDWRDNVDASMAHHKGEYKAALYGYKNQWRYRFVERNFISDINHHKMLSTEIPVGPASQPFSSYKAKWWHTLYKIPRRW